MGHASSRSALALTLIDSKRTAQDLLQEAERADFYLEECRDDAINALARRRLAYSANSITPAESISYQAHLNQMIPLLPLRLQLDLGDIRIVPLMPSADGGMPHTRPGNVVCYPILSQLHSKSTLTHELWHVHQRTFQEEWQSLFEQLGWTPWNGVLPPLMEKNRRFNPDTIDHPLWVYQNTWVPVPIFNDSATPLLHEVSIWWYHCIEKYHVKQIPTAIQNQFPGMPPSSYEHPRELTAYLLADAAEHRNNPALRTILTILGQDAIS